MWSYASCRKGGQAKFVKGPSEQSGDDETFTITTEDQTCDLSTSAKPVIYVTIGGVSRNVLIDSGSAGNVISVDTVQELQFQGLKIAALQNLFALLVCSSFSRKVQ